MRIPPTPSRPSACTPTGTSPTCAADRTRRRPNGSGRSSCSRWPARTGAGTPPTQCSRACMERRSSRTRSSTRYLERLEQARARDHRKLGRELDLFSFSELSPGSPFWHPAGQAIWNALARAVARAELARGYQEVHTPILYDVELWKQSGHWDKYRDHMYFTEVEGREMGLKPMNCPAHIQIYNTARRSHRDLPIRLAEQGLVHRHEPSGTLHGLLRVRSITQDDAHIFCTEEQIEAEVIGCLDFAFYLYDLFGLEPRLELSTRPPNRIGSRRDVGPGRGSAPRRLGAPRARVRRQRGRRRLLRTKNRSPHDRLDRSLVAARHGPARLRDARALRDDVRRRRQRRAHPGDDPPGAVRLLRAADRDPDRALRRRVSAVAGAGPRARAADRRPPHRVRAERRPSGCARPDCAPSSTTATSRSSRKIRDGELRKIPYMLVVGDREQEAGEVGVREHRRGDRGSEPLDGLIERLSRAVESRSRG